MAAIRGIAHERLGHEARDQAALPRHLGADLAVGDQAVANSIPVHERMEAIALIHDGERCHGAVVRNLITGELVAYLAKLNNMID